MKQFRIVFSGIVLICLCISCRSDKYQSQQYTGDYPISQLTDTLNSFLGPLMDYSFYPNEEGMLALGIFLQKGDDVLVDTSYYYSNSMNPKPNDSTLFQMGSVTKTFTAAMVARQVNNGQMVLDNPAQTYLPDTGNYPILPTDFDGETVNITMGELATMNSGLPRNVPVQGSTNSTPYLYAFQQIDNTALVFKPGSKCNLYSNLGFGILGLTLTAQAYPDSTDYYKYYQNVVVDSLLNFLNMKDTRITLDSSQISRRAKPYGCAGHHSGYRNPNWPMNIAAGALYSTTADMHLYGKAMIGESDFLTAQDLDTLTWPRGALWIDTCKQDSNYYLAKQAMAWVLNDDLIGPDGSKAQRYSKDGGLAGFSTFITCSAHDFGDTRYKSYVVLWINKNSFNVQNLTPAIMQLAYNYLE